jgi:serine/threonine protein phosphatase PrpC
MHGHLVAEHVKRFFASFYSNLENYLYTEKFYKKREDGYSFTNYNKKHKTTKPFFKEDFIYHKLTKNDYDFLKMSFYLAEENLKSTTFDINFSGTTLCIIIIIGEKVICANVGDSRAICIKSNLNTIKEEFYVSQLSIEHKPEDPQEKDRIEQMGGEVSKNSCKLYLLIISGLWTLSCVGEKSKVSWNSNE